MFITIVIRKYNKCNSSVFGAATHDVIIFFLCMKSDSPQSFMFFKMSRLHKPELSVIVVQSALLKSLIEPKVDPSELL